MNAYFASAGPSVPTESDINIPVGADNTIQLSVWTGDHMTGHMTRTMTVHKVVNKSKADTLPCSLPIKECQVVSTIWKNMEYKSGGISSGSKLLKS